MPGMAETVGSAVTAVGSFPPSPPIPAAPPDPRLPLRPGITAGPAIPAGSTGGRAVSGCSPRLVWCDLLVFGTAAITGLAILRDDADYELAARHLTDIQTRRVEPFTD